MALGGGTGQESWSPPCEQGVQDCNFGASSSLCWGQVAMVPKARHPFLPTHSDGGTGATGQLHAKGPGSPKSRAWWPGHTQLLHHPRKPKFFSCCCSSFLAHVTGQAHPHRQQTKALPKQGTAKGFHTVSPQVTSSRHTHPATHQVQHCTSDWYLWDKPGNTEIRFAMQMSLLP